MNNPILFLDLDGVITDLSFFNEAKESLIHIIKNVPNIQIVITSDWRIGSAKEDLVTYFNDYFSPQLNVGDYISGLTSIYKPIGETKTRVKEVIEYINEHNIIRYAVIDDLALPFPEIYDKNFLKIKDDTIGLTMELADKIVNHLKDDRLDSVNEVLNLITKATTIAKKNGIEIFAIVRQDEDARALYYNGDLNEIKKNVDSYFRMPFDKKDLV